MINHSISEYLKQSRNSVCLFSEMTYLFLTNCPFRLFWYKLTVIAHVILSLRGQVTPISPPLFAVTKPLDLALDTLEGLSKEPTSLPVKTCKLPVQCILSTRLHKQRCQQSDSCYPRCPYASRLSGDYYLILLHSEHPINYYLIYSVSTVTVQRYLVLSLKTSF